MSMMPSFFIDSDGYLWRCGELDGVKPSDVFGKMSECRFKNISCSADHIMAIDEYGFLWAFGSNFFGELGLGDNHDEHELEKLVTDESFTMVSCGNNCTMAIDLKGCMWGCGRNNYGQLGLEHRNNKNTLEKVPTDQRFVMVSCGHSFTMAIDQDGVLCACGSNIFGGLGFGCKQSISKHKFEKVPIDEKFRMVSCGNGHIIAIDENGCLWGCGLNCSGQLGLGDSRIQSLQWEKLPTDEQFAVISCGGDHTIAIDQHGFLWGVGNNEHGQLGLGDYQDRKTLEKIEIDRKFATVCCRTNYTMAIDEYGSLWCCGSNYRGQLGLDGNENRNKLEKVQNIPDVRSSMNNCLIKKRGLNTKGAHK